jgi:hypothetical protein
MIKVDPINYQLYWIPKGEEQLDGESWKIRIKEISDDLEVTGFNIGASF